ncbi:MAG: Insertion element protein [Desulfobacteraceae bacterium]|nr:MAG: Insertion element protein [Desulfobacteraceae bacterium]
MGPREIQCPHCQSEATYRYGKTWNRKQRYMCLVCGRQFILDPERVSLPGKPTCPVCGKTMHIYRRYPRLIRFRCSGYPECRHYLKISLNGGMCYNELLRAPGTRPAPHQIALD